MIDYIYGIYHIQDNKKIYIYVGITNEFNRRCDEHRTNVRLEYVNGPRKGHVKTGVYWEQTQAEEYKYIRRHNLDFDIEILEEVVEGECDITEDLVMVRMIREGHPLQNSKDGEKWTRWESLANRKDVELTKKSIRDYEINKPKDDIEVICDVVADLSRFKREIKWSLGRKGWKQLKREMCQTKVVDKKYTFKRQKKGDNCVVMINDSRFEGRSYRECYDYVVRGFKHWSDQS